MSIQPPLFDLMPPEIPNDAVTQGAYRRTDPETSKEAAKSINAETLEKHVYDYMVRRGNVPVILNDVIRDLKIEKVTASPRFAKLQKLGLIELTGTKRLVAASGAKQQEWKLKGAHVND
jgi:hypothetical protein